MQEPLNRISSELIGEGGNNQKPDADSNQEAQRDKLVGQNPGDQGGVQGVQEFKEFKAAGERPKQIFKRNRQIGTETEYRILWQCGPKLLELLVLLELLELLLPEQIAQKLPECCRVGDSETGLSLAGAYFDR